VFRGGRVGSEPGDPEEGGLSHEILIFLDKLVNLVLALEMRDQVFPAGDL
jgi:hypothetical protein